MIRVNLINNHHLSNKITTNTTPLKTNRLIFAADKPNSLK